MGMNPEAHTGDRALQTHPVTACSHCEQLCFSNADRPQGMQQEQDMCCSDIAL